MTGPVTPMGGMAQPAPQKTSGAAITSMIMGILGCVPLLTSLLAIVFSIVGFKATKNGRMKGRGFAIAGLILGILGVLGWGASGVFSMWLISASAEPRAVMHKFARDVADGNIAAAAAASDTTISQAELEQLNRDIRAIGTFTELTSSSVNIRYNAGETVCVLEGIALFSSSAKQFDAVIIKRAGTWKVAGFHVK